LGIVGNPVGLVEHHDLSKDGKITYYNLRINKKLYTHIPARMVESVLAKEHEHEESK